MSYTNHFHDIFKGFYICLMFDVSKRPTSYRVDVVPSFQLFLITFLVGSKRWGDACAYHGPPHPLDPNRKGGRDNQKLGTTATL